MRHHAARDICANHLEGRYELDVIDVLEQPGMAEKDKVIAPGGACNSIRSNTL